MNKRAKWETVGHISVDAGIIQIGDPCYDIRPDSFDSLMEQSDAIAVPHEGRLETASKEQGFAAAVVLQSGMGDGVYAVEIKRDPEFRNMIKEVRVKFF